LYITAGCGKKVFVHWSRPELVQIKPEKDGNFIYFVSIRHYSIWKSNYFEILFRKLIPIRLKKVVNMSSRGVRRAFYLSS
jgi:hypothetical protein